MVPDGRRAALTKEATEGVASTPIAPDRHEDVWTTADATPRRSGRYRDSIIEPGMIFDFRLTLTNSFPEIWRRVLVPEECTLSDLHYVISYSFGWFDAVPEGM